VKNPKMPEKEWNPSFATFTLEDNPVMNLDELAGEERLEAQLMRVCEEKTKLKKRIEKLEAALTEAVHVADDAFEKTDVYLGYNDAVQRHAKWIAQVSELIELPDKTALENW